MSDNGHTEVMQSQSRSEGSALMAAGDITPLGMIERAVSSGANIETLERLMDLQERYETREAKKAFEQAVSDLQSDIPEIVKGSTVDFTNKSGVRTNYKHEDLSEMLKALRPPLAKHGLSIRYRTSQPDAKHVSVTTILSHRMGHSEETTLTGPNDESGNKNGIQAIGSSTSYLQRYGTRAVIGIAAAADDDGRQGAPTQDRHQGQNGGPQGPQQPRQQAGQKKPDGPDPYKLFLADCARAKTKIGEDAYYRILGGMGFEHANQVPARLMRDLIGKLAEEARQAPERTESAQDATEGDSAQEPAQGENAAEGPIGAGVAEDLSTLLDVQEMADQIEGPIDDKAAESEGEQEPDPTQQSISTENSTKSSVDASEASTESTDGAIGTKMADALTNYCTGLHIEAQELADHIEFTHGATATADLSNEQYAEVRTWATDLARTRK